MGIILFNRTLVWKRYVISPYGSFRPLMGIILFNQADKILELAQEYNLVSVP